MLVALIGVINTAWGASISNAGFETDQGFGLFTFNNTSWTDGGSNSGTLRVIDGAGAGAATGGFSGNNVITIWGGHHIAQGIGEVVTDNVQIQLTFSVGTRADGGDPLENGQFKAGLFSTDDGTELASADSSNVAGGIGAANGTDGVLKQASVTFNPGVDHAKEGVGIEVRLIATDLTGDTEQIMFDDISVSVVPEPTTYALISGLGLVGMAAYRRHKLKKA